MLALSLSTNTPILNFMIYYNYNNMSSNKANQSVSNVKSREERDQHQAYCAKARYRAVRKSLPKKQRESDIRAERLAASKLRVFVEEQGFSSSSSYTLPVLASLATAVVTTVASSAVRRTFAKVDKASDSIANLCDIIKTKLSEFADFAKGVVGKLWVVPAAILTHTILNQFINVPLLPILSAGFLVSLFGPDLWEMIKPFFQPAEQSGMSGLDIGALICTTICASMIPVRSVPYAVGELMKRVGSFDRTKEGLESIFKHALSYAERIVNAVRSFFSLDEVRWIDASERLVRDYVAKIDAFEKRTIKGEMIPPEDLLTMADVQLEGMGLKAAVRDEQLSSDWIVKFHALLLCCSLTRVPSLAREILGLSLPSCAFMVAAHLVRLLWSPSLQQPYSSGLVLCHMMQR